MQDKQEQDKPEVDKVPEIDYKSENEKLLKELEEYKNTKKYALDQYHAMKQKVDADEAEKQRQEQERLTKEGKHEELYKSAQQRIDELNKAIAERDEKYNNEKLNALAKDLALQAGAEGYNVKFLSKEIRGRLAMNEGQVGVLDVNGKLTISTINDLVTEIKNNEEYHGLISDRKSSGGGAVGNMNSGAVQKKFSEMNEAEKVALYKSDPLKYEQAKKAT